MFKRYAINKKLTVNNETFNTLPYFQYVKTSKTL